MDDQSPMFEDDNVNQAKTWIQDNLRVIVSVFIVAAIALGIYSYSQRNQTVTDEGNNSLLETQGDQGSTSTVGDDQSKGKVQSDIAKQTAVKPELSRETDSSFIEQAERGNGSTHLARRALAHYLEKNPDSSLSAEHKVYIEDYLRKQVNYKGSVTSKTSLEFSKNLIKQGIEKSKQLNERQLQNLKKYSVHVAAYR